MKVLVVCARRYNGHELWTALGILRKADIKFEVVSTHYHIEDEVTGQPNVIERTLDDITPDVLGDEFGAFMVVSGNMKDTEAYWTDKRVIALVEKAGELDLPTAAICCSVPTIAPIAKGKKVSFYPLIRSRVRLMEHGAVLQTVAVSFDDKLVTAEHQMASQLWAETFVEVLQGKEPSLKLHDSKYTPKGRERKPIPELEHLKKMQQFKKKSS